MSTRLPSSLARSQRTDLDKLPYAFLENGGTIENAQAIAAHESPRTTRLYNL
jgi:hypothetical protein